MSLEDKNNLNIDKNISYWNSCSFEDYREWIDLNLKLNKFTTLSQFLHLQNFLIQHSSHLSIDKFFYLEKQFECSLELKLLDWANQILLIMFNEFSKEPKILKFQAQLFECEGSDHQLDRAANTYKTLIQNNIEDRHSIKKLLMFYKSASLHEDLRTIIGLWNDYLKVHIDDQEAWLELGEIYLKLSNYKEAIYCLEEVLLHTPYNCNIYVKLGDIFATIGTQETLNNALKYYSQALLIKPLPRAFWGLIFTLNSIYKSKKTLEEKHRQLYKIAQKSLEQLYLVSPSTKNLKINELLKMSFLE